ncbi:MAG: DUF3048 domain-containing protein [bacterium]
MNNNLVKMVILPILVFGLTAGIAYGTTMYLYGGNGTTQSEGPVVTPPPGGGLVIDPKTPRDVACPINGEMFTKTESAVWNTRRPIFAMLENSPEARPQSGLNSADVVYEAVSEGGVTRFGAVFYCGVSAKDTTIAPVRSARTTFVNLASEYNLPLYVHAGGANCSSADGGKTCTSDKRVMALEQLDSYGWRGSNDLDEFGVGIKAFKRDLARIWDIKGSEVAWEHGLTASTEKLFKYGKDTRGWTNMDPAGKNDWKDKFTPWTFKDNSKTPGSVSKIAYGFWESDARFNVTWDYDATKNQYLRGNGGEPGKDLNDGSQVTAKVVVVQYTKEYLHLDEHAHTLYDVIGTGKGLVFQDGTATEITWSKKDRESRTVFTDAKGKKIEFNRGRIFFAIIPIGNTVAY